MNYYIRFFTAFCMAVILTISLSGCRRRREPDPVAPTAPVRQQQDEKADFDTAVRIRSAIESRDFSAAHSMASEMIAKNPKDAQAHFLLGQARYEQGDYVNARKNFRDAIRLEPENRNYNRALYQTIMALGDESIKNDLPGEAIEFYKELIANRFRLDQSYDRLAQAYILTSNKLLESKQVREAESLLREAIQIIPKDPQLQLALATLLWDSERIMESERMHRRIARDYPAYVEGLVSYASLSYQMGEHRRTQSLAEEVLRLDPDNSQALRIYSKLDIQQPEKQIAQIQTLPVTARTQRARLQEIEGYENKRDFLVQLQPRFPDQAWIPYELSKINQKMGNFDQALAFAESAVNLDPKTTGYHLQFARCLNQRGRPDDALQVIITIEEDHDDKLEILTEKGRVYARMGDFEEAEKLWKQVLSVNPRYSQALFSIGQLKMESGLNEQAGQYLQKAVMNDPFNPAYRYFKGINLIHAGKREQAEQMWRESMSELVFDDLYTKRIFSAVGETPVERRKPTIVQTQPIDELEPLSSIHTELAADPPILHMQTSQPEPEPVDMHDSNYDLALEYARSGMFDQAKELFELVIQRNPRNFNALMNLGQVYLAKREHAHSCAYFLRALKIEPQNMFALRALASGYAELGLHSFAQQITSQVAQSYPEQLGDFPQYSDGAQIRNNPRAFEPLGTALIEVELYEEALTVIQTGISERPQQNSLYLLQGDVYRQMRDFESAIDSYQIARHNEPQQPWPLIRIGDLYLDAGQTTRAVGKYRQALDVDFIGPDSMFEIVERYEMIGHDRSARRIINHLRTMNLSENHIARLESHLGEQIIIDDKEERKKRDDT